MRVCDATLAEMRERGFSLMEEFPYRSWDLNRLAVHPDLVDAAERYLETTDLRLSEVELWRRTPEPSTTTSRCTGSHSPVVPRAESRYQQRTTFLFLSDVTEDDGPTRIVPYEDGKHVPYTPLPGVAARDPGIDLGPYREPVGGIIPGDSEFASRGRRQ